MYRIIIAGPKGPWGEYTIAPTDEASVFFSSEQAQCVISLDPSTIDQYDGIVIPGGVPDVDPTFYGEQNNGSGPLDPEMDRLQFAMIDRAVKLHKPMIGFCRGMQLINVYFGGTLIQDIGCKDAHRYKPGAPIFHEINNIPGSFMYELYGARMKGNSGHHQALKDIPECFRLSQVWCPDNETAEKYIKLAQNGTLHTGNDSCIPEAVYHVNYPIIGLQWHPELAGELYCKHLDLNKIRDYFYNMIENCKSESIN